MSPKLLLIQLKVLSFIQMPGGVPELPERVSSCFKEYYAAVPTNTAEQQEKDNLKCCF